MHRLPAFLCMGFSYEHEGWARRFFDNWGAALKWRRLEPYEKFADMIDRHWDGIAGEQGLSAWSKASTTKSASSSAAATAYATKTTFVSKSSPAGCQCFKLSENHPHESTKTRKKGVRGRARLSSHRERADRRARSGGHAQQPHL
jgi:hypothetical protein